MRIRIRKSFFVLYRLRLIGFQYSFWFSLKLILYRIHTKLNDILKTFKYFIFLSYIPQDYEKSRTLGSPYLSKEKIIESKPTSRHVSVQSLLKDDYQLQKQSNDYHEGVSDNEGSDKNPYIFPYTAEEDQVKNIKLPLDNCTDDFRY